MKIRLFSIFAVLMLAGPVKADVITIGNFQGQDCTFACTETLQQAYDSSFFSDPLQINSISFFSGATHILNATYTLSIGYMNGDYTSMTSNFAANRSSSFGTFGSAVLSGTFQAGDTHTFTGSFSYDPGQGDLLIEIVRSAVTGVNHGQFAGTNGTPDTLVARAYRFSELGTIYSHPGFAITTQFNGGPIQESAGVPSPGALALLGFGLIGLGMRRRATQTANAEANSADSTFAGLPV